MSPEKGISRRNVLRGIAGIGITITFAGCAEIELPQTTGQERNDRPPVPELQIDEEGARNLSVLYMFAIGTTLLLLSKLK